jgi:hypothetical protein
VSPHQHLSPALDITNPAEVLTALVMVTFETSEYFRHFVSIKFFILDNIKEYLILGLSIFRCLENNKSNKHKINSK